MKERVPVDFNTMNQDLESEDRRVRLHRSDVESHFWTGMQVILYDPTLEVEAILEFDDDHNTWWARPDWSTSVDLPYP